MLAWKCKMKDFLISHHHVLTTLIFLLGFGKTSRPVIRFMSVYTAFSFLHNDFRYCVIHNLKPRPKTELRGSIMKY